MMEPHKQRRNFLKVAAAAALAPAAFAGNVANSLASVADTIPNAAKTTSERPIIRGRYDRLLILIELKGGNDGFNTVVPYADPTYYALRPKIGIARDAVLQLSDRAGLHPSLEPLMDLWQRKELAVLQGVGYPAPNLSHFRSIEIWDTASASHEYLQDGWLSRVFATAPTPRAFAADAVVVGSNDLGPVAGHRTRAIALADTGQFLRQAHLAAGSGSSSNPALAHILKVEDDVAIAAARFDAEHVFATAFPPSAFGNVVKTASQVIANRSGVAALKLTLNGFDTHTGQPGTQARLFEDLATGIVALKSALQELNRWQDTIVLTYAEFGRRPRENLSAGTDHGTANVHFALGGGVRGGLYGEASALDRLSADGNVAHGIDFRSVYASVLQDWWQVPSVAVLEGKFETVPFVRG